MLVRRLASTAALVGAVSLSMGFSTEVPQQPTVGDRIECASLWGGETRGGEIIGERKEGGKWVAYLVRWDDGSTTITYQVRTCIVVPSDSDEPEGDEPEGDEPEADEPEGDEPEADEPEGDEPEVDEPETVQPWTEQSEDANSLL